MKKYIYPLLLPILLAHTAATAQRNDREANLTSLVETERAFSRMSVEKGMRESFLAYFAESGINFQPHPVRTREAILARPASEPQPPMTLSWEPAYADVSESGDFGYTTGPFVITDRGPKNLPPSHGYYFSVWTRQEDGSWKVLFDNGVTTPAPPSGKSPVLATAERGVTPKREGDRENRLNIPMKMEQGLLQAAGVNGLSAVFSEMTSERVRLYRNGMLPLFGRDSMVAYLERRNLAMTWKPLAWNIASSWDLFYAYGTYELRQKGDGGPVREMPLQEHGYYTRIWKRELDGKWRIVLDAAHPIPLEEQLREE